MAGGWQGQPGCEPVEALQTPERIPILGVGYGVAGKRIGLAWNRRFHLRSKNIAPMKAARPYPGRRALTPAEALLPPYAEPRHQYPSEVARRGRQICSLPSQRQPSP